MAHAATSGAHERRIRTRKDPIVPARSLENTTGSAKDGERLCPLTEKARAPGVPVTQVPAGTLAAAGIAAAMRSIRP